MKLHIVTIGAPKLRYAKEGWDEYWQRLGHYHSLRVTHLADKWAADAARILEAAGSAYKLALTIDGAQFSSPQLAAFLEERALGGRELCCVVGGPEGLPAEVAQRADLCLSLSKLTFPHDLAMVILLEALYRASTISAGRPYHK